MIEKKSISVSILTVLYVMGLITKCQKFQMNFLPNVLVVNKLFIKRTWDKLKSVQIVLIPSVFPLKNVSI